MHWNFWMRRMHRWGAILVALPFLIVIVTGLLLQLKKEWSWVQPSTMKGQGKEPHITWAELLEALRSQSEAAVQTWADVSRIDIQPKRGLAKVTANNHWEVQVDLATGKVLQTAYRRSDWIEALHDGSWFHDSVKLWVFLPSAVIVLGLWLTGMYLFMLPHWAKHRRKSKVPNTA